MDNIDKTVWPQHQTLEKRTQSLHYFHSFAVKDRIDASNLSDVQSEVDLSLLPLEMLLPTKDDLDHLLDNCTVMVSRILVEVVFSQFKNEIPTHIPHKYQNEMSMKS